MDREGTKISCAGGTCSASECGEVVARYTNPDGTKKPGWMKAPNGKPTHLTERQWVQVRTPAFKAWFGDWEATAHATLRASASSYDEVRATLSALKGQIFTNTESGITATLSGNSIDKIVSGKAVNKSISLQAHLAAAANITDLFQYGKLLHTEAGTRKGITVSRKFYAPFFHGSETLVAKITVNEYEGEAHSRLYSIEAMEIERPSGVLAPKESHNESQAVSPHSANLQNTLQQMVGSVNPDTVSKVVDENGEPLVVYHGSPNVFNAFRKPEDGSGMYFSPWKEFASEYGNTRSFFLNIRNPIEYDEDFEAINDVEEGEADGHIYLPQDIEGEIRQDRVGETEIIAFSPSQIKSATDNVGTFSRKNKDTRYNVTTDAPVESALATQGEARDEEGTVLLTHTPSGAVRFNIETYHDYTDRGGLVHKGTRNALKDYMTLPYGTKDKPMPPRMTVEDFEEYIRPMDTMYKYIKEISDSGKFVNFTEWCQRQPDFKTEDGKTFYKSLSSLINNGDYPINIDLATDCVRRESYTELLNRLTQMPDVRLEKLDKVKIAEVNKLLRAYGLSTACDLCFVEAKRLGIVAWADNFIQQWNYALRQYEKKNGLPESQPAMYGSDKYEDALLNSSITSLPAARQMDAETRINELHSLLTQFPPIIKEGKGSGKDGALSKDDKDFNKAINSSKKAYEQISSKIKEYQKKSRDAWKKEHGTLDGYEESDKDRQEMDKIWSGGRKSVRAKMMQAIAKYPELRHPMTLNEMLGSRGLDAIRKTNGEAYSTLFSLILQSSGAGTPKPLQAETPYKGEVLDGVTESKVEKANAHGGARLQSFDDFKPIFIFDYLQMFMDLQSRDLTLQVYSKEIAFVELFGGATNAKINVSLLAEAKMPDAWKKEYFAPAKVVGKQKNGKPQYETKTQVDERRAAILKRVNSFAGLICDSNGKIARHPITGAILGQEMHGRHSAPLSRVMELHNDPSMNGDVAGITVGLSVNHIIYNILQSYNGMVIPYHASGMSREAGEQSDVFMYVDFTDSQNTRRWNAKKKGGAGWENANTAKRTFDEFNFYEGEDKPGWDMRTRVREYVDYCYNTKRGVDNGVKWAPKFDFIVNAKAYKAYCDENELEFVPEFYDAMKADCTLTRDGHEVWNGYYKVITDFCCYRDMDENGNMLEHEVSSPHKPIRLNWDILQERIKKMFSEDGSVAIREANKRYLAEHIDAITEKAKALINGDATLDEVLEGVDRRDKDLFNYNQVQKELVEHRAAIEKAEPLVPTNKVKGSRANVEESSRANVFAEDRRNFDDDAPGSVRYMVDAEGNDVMAMSISWHWLRHIMAGAKQVETRPTKMVNYKGPLAGRTVYFYAPMTEYPSGKKSSFPLAGHLIGKATILDALPFKENGVVLESFKQRYRELKGVDFDESMMDLYPNDFGYILGDIQFLDKPIRAKSKNSRFFSPDETETSPEAMQALANIRQGIDPAIATAKQVEQAAEQARESWRYDITAYHGTSHDHERYHVAADEAIASASEGVTEKTLESAIRDIIENKRVAIKIDSPEEAEIILSGAMRFFREYSTRKIPLSTGSYLYFVPHPNAINRYNGDKSLAWAEYAIHAVTNDIFVNDKHMRKYNPQKCETIMPIIADIVAEDMASIEENGNVLFFKKLDNKHMGKVIARPVDSGNYEADLSEVTTSYTKGKFPANIMPLDRASKVNASKSGFSFTSTGPSSLPHRASVVQEGPVGDVLDYLSPDEERAIRRNVVADVRGD